MLTKWYSMASYCQDSNGFCRYGGICRPTACPMSQHVVIPDDEENEKEGNDDNEVS